MRDNFFIRTCLECGREFDLNDELDAEEYTFGHDCEPVDEKFERTFGGGY
jgi:hypothetical protein